MKEPILLVTMHAVKLRSAGRRKDENAWKDYTIAVLEDLVCKFVYDGPVDEPVKLPPSETLTRMMPPIWMSLPEPNQVRVFVSAYDRRERKSEAVELHVSPEVRRILERVD